MSLIISIYVLGEISVPEQNFPWKHIIMYILMEFILAYCCDRTAHLVVEERSTDENATVSISKAAETVSLQVFIVTRLIAP
jgi:hypothetical protein